MRHTEEWKLRIGALLKGRPKPPRTMEHSRKIAIARKGIAPWNKGKIDVYSEETKTKISETLKRKNIRPPSRKGFKPSEKNISILKSLWKNKNRTAENRINSSIGAKKRLLEGRCNLYLGGKTKLKEQIRDSVQYKIWRDSVFKRDNYVCVDCGAKSGNGKAVKLEADHLKGMAEIIHENNVLNLEIAINCADLWDINNGKTRCKSCHVKTYNYGVKEAKRLSALRKQFGAIA